MDDLASAYDYALPETAIAQRPAARRDACRLAAVERRTGKVQHLRFSGLPGLLKAGDLLVLNDSKVLPARIPCQRASGGKAEAFLLGAASDPTALPCFVRPAAKLRDGEALTPLRDPSSGSLIVGARGALGLRLLSWRKGRRAWSSALLQRLGLPPLPPYIRRETVPSDRQQALDRAWYQTTFARHLGSVAAPTAGLHFTPGLLKRLAQKGVKHACVTLHVGAGTFQPVKTERLADHVMHVEACQVPPATAAAIKRCRQNGGRVIAVGTTALRCLESSALDAGRFKAGWHETQLFVRPGYRFKAVDGLITNFHQPRSTLLALVSAFWDREALLGLYKDCLSKGYRFLSYGDACAFL